jgi:hypothetical protein
MKNQGKAVSAKEDHAWEGFGNTGGGRAACGSRGGLTRNSPNMGI